LKSETEEVERRNDEDGTLLIGAQQQPKEELIKQRLEE